jgi:hypothetical protein
MKQDLEGMSLAVFELLPQHLAGGRQEEYNVRLPRLHVEI